MHHHQEHAPWKAIFWGTGASIFLFALAFFFLAPGNLEYFTTTLPEKVLEFSKLEVVGKEEGKLSYRLYAEEGWASKNNVLTVLKDIKTGGIYQEGKLIAKSLKANLVRIHKYSKEVEFFDRDPDLPDKKPLLEVQIDLGKFAEQKEKKNSFTKIRTPYLKYIEPTKKSILEGNIAISGKTTTVKTMAMEVDHQTKNALFVKGLILSRKDILLKGDKAYYYFKDEKIEVEGNVRLEVKNQDKNKNTILECQKISIFSDPKKDLIAQGAVRIVQPKKVAFASEALYNQDKKTLTLKNQVEAIINKAADILKAETIKNIDDPDTKESIKEKTILKSNLLTIYTESEDALAENNVEVIIKNKQAKADLGKYVDKDDNILLTGNVYLKKKENEWLKAKKILVSVKDESFEAIGEVQTEFKVKK